MAPKRKSDGQPEEAGPRRSVRGHAGSPSETVKKSTKSKDVNDEGVVQPSKKAKDLPDDPPAEALPTETEQVQAPAKKGSGTLRVGQAVPGDIIVTLDDGTEATVQSLLAAKGAVFFVYPKANTPGCTKQACAFRDAFGDFEKLDYQVFGLSQDSPKSQTTWKTKQSFGYTLLCDKSQALIKPLGASKSATSVTRSHFVVEKGGRILDSQIGVKPDASSKDALEFIKKHQKA